MAGQPMKNPNDAMKFREQYLATLDLQAKLNDINLQANKTYLRTGQLPVEVNDFRTSEEKLKDKQFVAIQVQSALKEIMTGNNAQRTTSQLTSGEIDFYAQSYPAINALIKPQYKLGVLAEVFVPYLRNYMRNSQQNMNVADGLQQTSGKSVQLNGANQPFIVNKEDLDLLASEVSKLGGDASERTKTAIGQLKSILPPTDIYDKVTGIMNPMTQNRISRLLNSALQDLPRKTDLVSIGREIQEANNLGDGDNSRRVLNKLTQLLTLPNQSVRDLVLVKQQMSTAGIGRQLDATARKVQEELVAQERQIDAQTMNATRVPAPIGNTGQVVQGEVLDWERLKRASEFSREQADNRPDGLNAEQMPEPDEPQFDLPMPLQRAPSAEVNNALSVFRQGTERLKETRERNTMGAEDIREQLAKYRQSLTSGVIEGQAEQAETQFQDTPDLPDPFLGENKIETILSKDFLKQYDRTINIDINGNTANNSKGGGEYPTYADIFKIDMKTVDFQTLIGSVLSDLSRLYKALEELMIVNVVVPPQSGTVSVRRADFERSRNNLVTIQDMVLPFISLLRRPSGSGIRGRGIGVQNQSYPLGKYLIKGKQLNGDIINIKTRTNQSLKKFPATKVSANMGKIMRVIAGGGVPAFDDMEQLTQPEKSYLHKIAKETDLIGRFSIPTPDKTKEDKEKDEFDLLKGQILSGNDNAELVKKFKSLLIRLSTRGDLPKGECREILMDLVSMGY